jgi:hypothetical protein
MFEYRAIWREHEVTKTGTATDDIDTDCACSIGSSCDKNTQHRDGGAKMLMRYEGASDVHFPATTSAIFGGAHSIMSAVATAHMNSTSGGSKNSEASDVMASQERT